MFQAEAVAAGLSHGRPHLILASSTFVLAVSTAACFNSTWIV